MTSDLIDQNRKVIDKLKLVIQQKSAENRQLHEEREFHFRHTSCRKRKRDEGTPLRLDGDNLIPIEQLPDLSDFLRLPQDQHSEEPDLNPF